MSWRWLLLIPALFLQTLFNIGATLIFARLGAFLSDISQLLPFITRTWLYASGIFFSIPDKLDGLDAPGWVIHVLSLNPISAYIDIVRRAVLDEHEQQPAAERLDDRDRLGRDRPGRWLHLLLACGGQVWPWLRRQLRLRRLRPRRPTLSRQ